ncbi:hypothetical protein LAUMK35_00002 [Mycobacterium pseudokansasii]|nr:hypothetical protein LAUMK35_00002 [Mycobacterium pseudokansasii]VAZ87226.1 hypothetical protein LAUMK21_00001 [Mycobacterium pseudokansasii]
MPSGPPPFSSITGELASAPNRSGRIRHFGVSITPFDGRTVAGMGMPARPASPGTPDPWSPPRPAVCAAVESAAGVKAIQCCGARSSPSATRRIWVAVSGMADSGARRLRQAGAAPTSANPVEPLRFPAAACSSVAHCTRTFCGSNRPAADTTSSVARAVKGRSPRPAMNTRAPLLVEPAWRHRTPDRPGVSLAAPRGPLGGGSGARPAGQPAAG